MNCVKALLITILCYSFTPPLSSQPPKWVQMKDDPTVNFYDVQKEAESYFSSHPKGKGSGYKQYKRWEWANEQRYYPDGDRSVVDPAIAWKEINKFHSSWPATERSLRNPWTEIGPNTCSNVTGHWSPGIGRIDVIALDPDNNNIIYCGSPSGGLWKSSNGGSSWICLTDDLPVIGISGIVIDHSNSDIIYIATGDKDASAVYSIGVLKSTDGGGTWNTTGLSWDISQYRIMHKLLMHPTNSSIIFAGTSNGLYKTTNAGSSWSVVQSGDIEDIEFKPGDPDIVYASTVNFYKSTNGGDSFSSVSVTTSGRTQIAVTEDNPEYVYVVSSGSGVYRSTNSGSSFSYRGSYPDNGNVAWYALSVAANHTDAEQLHVGEFETFVSNNGGQSFTKTSVWTWGNSTGYVHCDIHEMVFYGGTIYVGSDGMISKSSNGGSTWTNLTEGIANRQFYRISCSATNQNMMMGGSQDNGTSVLNNGTWYEWLGADGMECVIDWSDADIVYGTSQNGSFYKSDNGGNYGDVNISQPGSGAWITPFVIDPSNHNTLYVGTDQVRKTTNGMGSWTTIGDFGSGDIDALAVAQSDPAYLYASKDSRIWMTSNGGSSWSEITSGLPSRNITYISVHPADPLKVALSFSGYGSGQKVYTTDNGGSSWTNFSGNLPNLPANCVVYHNDTDNGLYVGMDVGVYYRDNTLSNWESYMEGLPNVIVNELEIHYGSGKIRAGTYGRGIWEADLFNGISSPPVANFTADLTSVIIGSTVDFTDLSSGAPTTWSWTFQGGSPSSSTTQNPSVVYNTEGTYDVSLTVTNDNGSDTEIKTGYITVLPITAGFSLDFEACTDYSSDFSPWISYEGDGQNSFQSSDCDFPGEGGAFGFMAFNPSDAGFSLASAHNGVRVGMAICPSDGSTPADDWIISPKLLLGDNSSLSFWVLTAKPGTWGNESYNVLVSTTDNDPASFSSIASNEEAPDTWTERTYNLSAYDNQDIHIGIQCVSLDKFMFWVDDISINTTVSSFNVSTAPGITVYPNPVTKTLYINFNKNEILCSKITIFDIYGKQVKQVENPDIKGKTIKIDLSDLANGIYYLQINNYKTEKITLIR